MVKRSEYEALQQQLLIVQQEHLESMESQIQLEEEIGRLKKKLYSALCEHAEILKKHNSLLHKLFENSTQSDGKLTIVLESPKGAVETSLGEFLEG